MAHHGIQYKTRGELQAMRASGVILARAIAAGRAVVRPGVTTADVDAAVAAVIAEAGATSNFLHYGAHGSDPGFPATICASVNDEVVHGIPGPRVLLEGDLLSIDAGCILDGWHSDSAISVHVGDAPDMAEVDLINATSSAMWAGIAAINVGGRLGDVSWAIETSAEKSGAQDGRRYGSVSGYGGHGIGTAMHMEPFIPNQGKRGKGPRLAPGMALAIEPMLTLGRPATKELDDGWTVVTRDGARAAHFEHSVAVLEDGICVLTAADGGAADLAPYGVTPVSLD
ncbi:methionyl aminopeptidase [Nakamurella panacisegetis]|uniref:Methionine aminopeptidase n=1 Tax=Nakamurella panacisegetis TaxID=1090615 RepID=A0A1H0P1T9_9ACTN|nr:type I methionyl aminopeptidase [Nakamurella panacisegetis]SDO98630.1 methionyl aminopeptidase [Nakamurella panacisegetis]